MTRRTQRRILSVTRVAKKMIWSDAHTERIEEANLDGSARRTIYTGSPDGDPFGVALQGPFVYWTDWNIKGLFRIQRDGTKFERLFQNYFRGLNDIKFFNRSAQTGPRRVLF